MDGNDRPRESISVSFDQKRFAIICSVENDFRSCPKRKIQYVINNFILDVPAQTKLYQ